MPLAAITDPSLLATSLLTALKLQHNAAEPPQSRLIEHLRRKELLLVLDNFEQLLSPPLRAREGTLPSVSLVATLLAECAGLRLLVTSRERLHLRAEQRYRVPPLAMTAAVELFSQRAAAVDPNFVLSAKNRPTVEAICQRLDRLPLALELCAAQIDLLSPTQLLTHLQSSSLDLLVEGAHDLPPQQRTLRGAIFHSYQLLNEKERALLRSLGVFVGGFELTELEVVAGWVQEQGAPSLLTTLHALIGKSLVHIEPLATGEQRFLLLETIRAFALEQALTQGEETALRERHYAAYLQLFRTGDSHLRGAEAVTWFARLEVEQDNLRVALQWSLDAARYEEMAWLLLAASGFWNHRGQGYEGCQWLVPLLPHCQGLEQNLRLAVLIIFHAHAAARQEAFPAGPYHGEMKSLLAQSPPPLLQVAAWVWVGVYATDFSQTIDAYERAITQARIAIESAALGAQFGLLADHDFMLGVTLQNFGLLLSEQGDIARAISLVTEGFQFLQARGNRHERADGLGLWGHLALLRGDLAQARTFLQEAVEIAMAVKSEAMLIKWQPLFGLVLVYSNDATLAQRLLTEGLRLGLAMQNKQRVARVCIYLAESALWEGHIDEAAEWLRQSLGYHPDPRRITIYEVQQTFIAARLATVQQQYLRAATLFGLAEQVHSQIHHVISGPMRALADAALATVQTALEPAAFAEAFAAGQQMSLAEALVDLRQNNAIAALPMHG
ncbi:MAG: ATP-binding protein [Caldilineaceae bacterium]